MSAQDQLLHELAQVLDQLTPVVARLSGAAPQHDELWTGEILRTKLNIDADTVTLLVQAGMPHYRHLGKGYRYKPSEVFQFIERFRHIEPQPELRRAG